MYSHSTGFVGKGSTNNPRRWTAKFVWRILLGHPVVALKAFMGMIQNCGCGLKLTGTVSKTGFDLIKLHTLSISTCYLLHKKLKYIRYSYSI